MTNKKPTYQELENKIEKLTNEIMSFNKELEFQNKEKGKRAAELIIANKELSFENEEKEKRAAELIIANKELLFQNSEKEKRAVELIIANKELVYQNELKEKRADELAIAKEQAEESDRLKYAFLANMSHEIRTPLNSIIGFSKIISEKSEDSDENRKMRYFVEYNSNILIKIIDDIIDISKIEAGIVKFTFEPVNLHNFLTDIYNNQKQILEDSKKNLLELHYNKPKDDITIRSDKFRLGQIFNNLISNAIRYSESGAIEFGFDIMESHLQFYVKDTGVGLSETDQVNIFSRFYKAASNETLRGIGLGLAIVKQLVEKMDGKIWVESEIENLPDGKKGGSTFYFSLPYQKASIPVPEVQNKSNPVDIKGKLALVAEDDDGNFYLTKMLLEEMGINVLRAVNGLEAVEICKVNDNISFVLMDIKMPIMDGLEATTKIRESKKDLLIVALSAHVMDEAKITALNAGCNDYISKPVDREKLYTHILKYEND
ncbi:MAG: response regulator [Bacteroidetes bacterium]|nr:response regulator [Bacteroidota bacterium]